MNESIFPYTYAEVLQTLRKRLREPAPARAQILSGPRQVGKTTLLGEITDEWSDQAVYAPADTTEASLSDGGKTCGAQPSGRRRGARQCC